ncbi:4'-phosphopantetheinyl transferase family protein [Cellulosimicrobium cellulans]|uniref:4'-phosphopantetheinyl transferase family protein n=1 Tax=Cellulosimicrobium cellulans TaxID=1710 RepID=UPI0036E95FDD
MTENLPELERHTPQGRLPARDTPPPGVCDIWVAGNRDADRWASWLSAPERQGLDPRRPADTTRITSYGLQRVALAAYTGVAPHELTIDRRCTRCGDRAHGRPTVTGGPVYSVTRTASFVALAVVTKGMVGIDAEQVLPRDDLAEIATLLGQTSTDTRTILTAWVRHEAALKARGQGIADLWPTPTDAAHGLEMVDLALPGAVLALAASQTVHRVRWTHLRPGGRTSEVPRTALPCQDVLGLDPSPQNVMTQVTPLRAS